MAVACAPGDFELEAVGRQTGAVVNGSVDNGDPAAVSLSDGTSTICSGTLITPTVVVTAAHCVPPHTPYVNSFTDISVFFGTYLGSGGTFIQVTDGWVHSGWNINVSENDIALLRLQSAGPATPIPYQPSDISAADVGASVRVIGFGYSDPNDLGSLGTKREGTSSISELFNGYFTTDAAPANVCGGDSGGTTLMMRNNEEVLVGIHSRADEDCSSLGLETSVASHIADIQAFTGALPGPTCDQDGQCATGCPAPDPDCPCAADGYCTAACVDATEDPDCGCGADGQCEPLCPVDPDCECAADGYCDPSCVADPDCASSCPADGSCDKDCPSDPDCMVAGDAEEIDYDEVVGSCRFGAPAPRGIPHRWLVLLMLPLLRRRRRSSRS